MCVNDTGFIKGTAIFPDYYACGQLNTDEAASVIPLQLPMVADSRAVPWLVEKLQKCRGCMPTGDYLAGFQLSCTVITQLMAKTLKKMRIIDLLHPVHIPMVIR